jgi:hypothetical protein
MARGTVPTIGGMRMPADIVGARSYGYRQLRRLLAAAAEGVAIRALGDADAEPGDFGIDLPGCAWACLVADAGAVTEPRHPSFWLILRVVSVP